jgi:hypothetical protein
MSNANVHRSTNDAVIACGGAKRIWTFGVSIETFESRKEAGNSPS